MTRRLQILPEVLPAPTPAAPSPNVRGRTLAHMQRLLATAAVMPLACTKADTQGSQTITIPTVAASDTGQQTHGTLIPETHTAATATATATTTADIGYAVVDPMPAPARCMGLAAASQATATFTSDATGPVLDVHVTLPTGGNWSGSNFTPGAPSPWSGQLVSHNVTGNSARARIRPTAGTTSLGVSFSVMCTAGPGSIAVTANFNAIANGAKVTLQKNDY